jgi:uncharacterized membrane protein YphA (DoxX/SURF4 family)
LRPLELPGWKSTLSWTAAILLAVLFLASGLWKIMDAQAWAQRVQQLLFPGYLSQAAALVAGVAETLGAVLIVVPRFRRWGAMLIGLLLVVFMAYFAINYNALRGADCSCFPWVKRMVGPGFFASDAAMLALAFVAGLWSKPSGSLRPVLVIAGAVVVFALVSYGVNEVRQTGTRAPSSILVGGQPYSIERGRYLLFFFHPACTHCLAAAKQMSSLEWGSTTVVAIPVAMPQFSAQFLEDSGLKAVISPEFQRLAPIFGYTSYPFGVAIENGREKTPLTRFDESEPTATLRQIGFVK